jgi:hypothetical protein
MSDRLSGCFKNLKETLQLKANTEKAICRVKTRFEKLALMTRLTSRNQESSVRELEDDLQTCRRARDRQSSDSSALQSAASWNHLVSILLVVSLLANGYLFFFIRNLEREVSSIMNESLKLRSLLRQHRGCMLSG